MQQTKWFRFVNWYSKGELRGITLPPTMRRIDVVLFYARTIIEATVYHIVGHDKFLKWLWLHDFFETWH
jgi:hypothetical protein